MVCIAAGPGSLCRVVLVGIDRTQLVGPIATFDIFCPRLGFHVLTYVTRRGNAPWTRLSMAHAGVSCFGEDGAIARPPWSGNESEGLQGSWMRSKPIDDRSLR